MYRHAHYVMRNVLSRC
uniref:Uncharacterized protein n=1 Tax=Arundo donax TaxID=35708 RepID=A0A0A9AKS8_ARUDO